MERATFVRMNSLFAVAAVAIAGACTDAGTREAALQDSAIQANEQPAPAAQPVQAESVTTAPRPAPVTSTSTPATPATPRTSETPPPLRQPPPPRDTRPSIPYPPDTI
jgi:hypothetical protein